MKKTSWKTIALTCLMLFVAFAAEAKDRKPIARGMDKQEVIAILGSPHASSFDEYGEHWEYVKSRGAFLNQRNTLVSIEFDRDGKVVKCQETLMLTPNDGYRRPYGGGGYPDAGYPDGAMGMVLDEDEFGWLLDKIRSASFDDNKLGLVEVASLRCCYTSGQCARILSLFSFSDGKMRALQSMAPHVVEMSNAYEIYNSFSFDSDKEKAARILKVVP